MKKVLVLMSLILSASFVFAQAEELAPKGKFFLGAAALFYYQDDANISGQKPSSGIGLAPTLGYQYSEKTQIGLRLGYTYGKTHGRYFSSRDTITGTYEKNVHQSHADVFLRRTIWGKSGFKVFIEPQLVVSLYRSKSVYTNEDETTWTTEDNKPVTLAFQFDGGLSYDFNRRFRALLVFDFLGIGIESTGKNLTISSSFGTVFYPSLQLEYKF